MSSKHKYVPNDLVWAKMRGYPQWPARVVPNPHDQKPAYSGHHFIFFYGTHQVAWMASKDLLPFDKYRQKFRKCAQRTGFNEALWEAEEDPQLETSDAKPILQKLEQVGRKGRRKRGTHISLKDEDDKSVATKKMKSEIVSEEDEVDLEKTKASRRGKRGHTSSPTPEESTPVSSKPEIIRRSPRLKQTSDTEDSKQAVKKVTSPSISKSTPLSQSNRVKKGLVLEEGEEFPVDESKPSCHGYSSRHKHQNGASIVKQLKKNYQARREIVIQAKDEANMTEEKEVEMTMQIEQDRAQLAEEKMEEAQENNKNIEKEGERKLENEKSLEDDKIELQEEEKQCVEDKERERETLGKERYEKEEKCREGNMSEEMEILEDSKLENKEMEMKEEKEKDKMEADDKEDKMEVDDKEKDKMEADDKEEDKMEVHDKKEDKMEINDNPKEVDLEEDVMNCNAKPIEETLRSEDNVNMNSEEMIVDNIQSLHVSINITDTTNMRNDEIIDKHECVSIDQEVVGMNEQDEIKEKELEYEAETNSMNRTEAKRQDEAFVTVNQEEELTNIREEFGITNVIKTNDNTNRTVNSEQEIETRQTSISDFNMETVSNNVEQSLIASTADCSSKQVELEKQVLPDKHPDEHTIITIDTNNIQVSETELSLSVPEPTDDKTKDNTSSLVGTSKELSSEELSPTEGDVHVPVVNTKVQGCEQIEPEESMFPPGVKCSKLKPVTEPPVPPRPPVKKKKKRPPRQLPILATMSMVDALKTFNYNLKISLIIDYLDSTQALRHLRDLLDLTFTTSDIEQVKDLVLTLRKVRNYKNNARIRNRAEEVYSKIKGLYVIGEVRPNPKKCNKRDKEYGTTKHKPQTVIRKINEAAAMKLQNGGDADQSNGENIPPTIPMTSENSKEDTNDKTTEEPVRRSRRNASRSRVNYTELSGEVPVVSLPDDQEVPNT